MYPHLTDQIITQHQTDMRTDARRSHRDSRQHRHPVRKDTLRQHAGHALVTIGLRLAYTADEG
jgi:hypothetical protein